MLAMWLFLLPISYAQEDHLEAGGTQDVVLTPADQLILESINSLARQLNGRIDNLGKELNVRIDKINDRIDNLWITMLGGFLGVMAFIGGLVFWDRRTFLKRAREECRDEVSVDRKKVEAMLKAMRKLSERFPEVREVLNSFGLL
jgi:hypothetical protein